MAPGHSKTSNSDNGDTPRQDVLLPLVPLPPSELNNTNSVAYHLLSNPADADSSKYKVIARIIDGTEDIRTLILWSKDVDKVLKGLNLTQNDQFDQCVTITQSMMRGRVISIHNSRIQFRKEQRMNERAQHAYTTTAGDAAAKRNARDAITALGWAHADNNTFAMLRVALNDTLEALMPKKALARCKRHLRRYCRKPRGMRVREFVHLVQHMNLEEFTSLPPFDPNQHLPDDEILDVVLFGIPKNWEREMDKQGFDPFANQLADVLAKLEDIETAEGFDAEPAKPTPKKDKKRPAKETTTTNDSGAGNNKKHCMYHGWGSHTTDECEHLKKQVKKLKSGNETKDNDKKKSYDGKKDNAGKGKSNGQDGFVTFMNRTVQKAVKKAVKSSKRKADCDSDSS